MTAAMPDATDQDFEDDDGGGGTSVSDYTGGTSGSGSNDAKERKRAMQGYLQVIYNLYGRWNFTPEQQRLANKAWNMRFSPSGFLSVLRREDPRYVRTVDYKNRIRDAQLVYQAFRGYGRPMPREFGDQYARSGLTKQRLIGKIEKSAWFKKRFPGWKQAVNSGVVGRSTSGAAAYLSMRDMLNNAFRAQSGDAPNAMLHRMMFSAGMGEEEVAKNLAGVFGGQEALSFATGQLMGKDDILRAALTKKFGTSGLSQIARSQSKAQSFQASQLRPFDVGIDEKTGSIVMPRL